MVENHLILVLQVLLFQILVVLLEHMVVVPVVLMQLPKEHQSILPVVHM